MEIQKEHYIKVDRYGVKLMNAPSVYQVLKTGVGRKKQKTATGNQNGLREQRVSLLSRTIEMRM